MASCNSFPTLTSTAQLVTNSLSTSTTSHVTTLPPTTTTITLTPSCTASSGSCAPVVTVSEIPGGTSTVVDTVTITVPITSSQVTTLWGSSCSSTGPNTPPPPTSTSSDTSTPPPSPSFSTPPPSVFVTSSSSTAANGNVTPIILTITSTAPPVLVSSTPSAVASGSVDSDSSRSLGPIIGGVVGGVVGLCALIFLVWFFLRRRQRWDDIFDNDVPVVDASINKKEKLADSGPKPYQYGLVGHTKTSSLTSLPSSPPLRTATLLDGDIDRSHYRNSSTAPLLDLSTGNTAHVPDTSPSARPPSSSSALGIGSQANTNTQGQVRDPRGFPNNPSQWHSPFPGSSAMGSVGPIPTTVSGSSHRSGSPVSFQERRILQVTNADLYPLSPQAPENRSLFSTGTPLTEPQQDGKGRIMTRGEKAPIVHLDGGRYQGGAAGSSSAVGPAPPAYSE